METFRWSWLEHGHYMRNKITLIFTGNVRCMMHKKRKPTHQNEVHLLKKKKLKASFFVTKQAKIAFVHGPRCESHQSSTVEPETLLNLLLPSTAHIIAQQDPCTLQYHKSPQKKRAAGIHNCWGLFQEIILLPMRQFGDNKFAELKICHSLTHTENKCKVKTSSRTKTYLFFEG